MYASCFELDSKFPINVCMCVFILCTHIGNRLTSHKVDSVL